MSVSLPDTAETAAARRPRAHSLDHALLGELHERIATLIRLVVQALLFAEDPAVVFGREIEPVIASLLACLQRTYGADHPGLSEARAGELGAAILATRELVRSDVDAALANDPATEDPLEVIFCYPGFKATLAHRVAHVFYRAGLPLVPRLIAERAHEQTGIDIHPGATIGSRFFIDHGTGVVIGQTARIGDGVTLYQGVTLGAKRFPRDAQGQIIKGQPRHPILEDGVTVYSGATILGRITVGRQSVIGGNVWLTESVGAHSRITQQHFLASYFKDGDGI